MISISHLTKTYGTGAQAHTALSDISLDIKKGDIYGIIGQSGAGKSTLVRCLNLLEEPTDGEILIEGKDISQARGKELLALRSNMGMIFQNFSLFQQRSVLDNVAYPLHINKVGRTEAQKRAHDLLKRVGLDDHAHKYPSQLSGGQQQRVAIARALANNPHIMLCDEATSALDTRNTAQILDLLKDINAELGVTMVVITHSLAVAEKICNKIAVLDAGRIVEAGDTHQILHNPTSPITQELIAQDCKPSKPHEAFAHTDKQAY